MTAGVVTANWDDVPVETVLPGITRAVVHGARQSLVRYRYEPGSVFPEHSHPQEQVTVVLSGRIAFEIGGMRRVFGPGDVAVIPGGVPHGAEVVGSEVVDTLNTLSPRRDDAPTFGGERTESRSG